MTRKLARLRATLRRYRLTYWDIAQAAGVSEPYVWMALAGRRRASRVIETAERLVVERKAEIAAKAQG